jgi:hypothetical protein
MASSTWINIKTRWNAMLSELRDAFIVAFWQTFGLHSLGAAASGRLTLRKATNEMHRQWAFASGVHHLKPTPQNVSRFIQDTFDIPFEMPDGSDGRTLNRAERELIFTAVSKVLVAQGRFQLA